ncbi:MAG TPA: hypothetical protein PJ991_13445, partial [Kiritimatiellia bacterium]|nr:hypothetical protein [Kiritimatiellia bacterium]
SRHLKASQPISSILAGRRGSNREARPPVGLQGEGEPPGEPISYTVLPRHMYYTFPVFYFRASPKSETALMRSGKQE